jgi:hypothetical protein
MPHPPKWEQEERGREREIERERITGDRKERRETWKVRNY